MSFLLIFLLLFQPIKGTSTNLDYGSKCEDSCMVTCASDFEKNGDRCFYWSSRSGGNRTWYGAENYCRWRGGHLATIKERQLRWSTIATRWMGGIREAGNNAWVWSDCSPWIYTAWSEGTSKKQPDKDTCLSFSGDQKMNEESCTNNNTYICSVPVCSGDILFKVSD